MNGEKNLRILISSMKPKLEKEIYVFCTLPPGNNIPKDIKPIGIFQEQEGTTLIIQKQDAEKAEILYEYESRMITMTINSSLNAIGFLAAITAILAENEISVNAVSAFYHDHLFIEKNNAEQALKLLEELSKQ